MSYGVVHRRYSDPALLWLWCQRLAAAAPILPLVLATELPYAATVALKKQKKKKKKRKTLITARKLR